MKIKQFNTTYENQFKFVEIEPYTRHNNRPVTRFNLYQWCPIKNDWCRMLMPGSWNLNLESKTTKKLPASQCSVPQRILNGIESPHKHIIVCREKHSTEYFQANSTEDIGRACVHIVKRRNDEGFYPDPDDPPQEPKTKPEDIEDKELSKACQDLWNTYNNQLKWHKEDLKFHQDLEKVLKEDNYFLAKILLESRSNYEYEGFTIETLTSI